MVNILKNVTSSSFGIDLDTPPHELVPAKCTEKCDEQPCDKENDETARDVELLEYEMSADHGDETDRDVELLEYHHGDGPIKCIEISGQKLQTPYEKKIDQAVVELLGNQMSVDTDDHMKDGQQPQKHCEKETVQATGNDDLLELQTSVDVDHTDTNIVRPLEKENKGSNEISQKPQVGELNFIYFVEIYFRSSLLNVFIYSATVT